MTVPGLPLGGPVIENPPSSAGDLDLILGWGTKIAHTTGQLSLSTAMRNPCGAAGAGHSAVTREAPCITTRPSKAKNLFKLKK